jgi:hypothetical protein
VPIKKNPHDSVGINNMLIVWMGGAKKTSQQKCIVSDELILSNKKLCLLSTNG